MKYVTMINELKNGFLAAFRLLMCLPLAVSWMLLYALIWLSYGTVRGDQFIMMWNAFVSNDTPVDNRKFREGSARTQVKSVTESTYLPPPPPAPRAKSAVGEWFADKSNYSAEYQHCALDPSGPTVCKKGSCGCG